MANCLYESNWQRLPIELQKYFIIMIANTQKQINYRGFGTAVLELETFSCVLKTAFKWYMMFKAIAE